MATRSHTAKGWVRGEHFRFVKGHNRAKERRGPAVEYVDGKQRLAHVVVAEAALGKPLPIAAVVHHIDGDNRNNAGSNLVICQDQNYHMLLHHRAWIVKHGGNPNTDKVCCVCHQPKPLDQFYRASATRDGRQSACVECR